MSTATPIDVRSFEIHIPDGDLEDLRDRLGRTRWPEPTPDERAWTRGVPADYLRSLVEYWRDGFDWRAQERALNDVPQFTLTVDGQPIHFIHVRSKEAGALPLLLLHSWPGSPIEFARLIGPLTDPGAHGGESADAFHVVVPSLPGFGFSNPVTETGWTTGRAAHAFASLMASLGYERYGVHGGDIGAGVGSGLTSVDAAGVVALHVATDPPTAVSFASWSGDPATNPGLSEAEKARVEELKRWSKDDEGYLRLQSTRPQTIGYALTDSPVGQLAWMVEKFQAWTDRATSLPEEAIDRDQMLANVSLFWFTRSGASAAHALYESMNAQEWTQPGPAPVGFAVFGAEPFVRTLQDPDRRIEHWSEFERGGHFPALEQPGLLTDDLRTFFRGYR